MVHARTLEAVSFGFSKHLCNAEFFKGTKRKPIGGDNFNCFSLILWLVIRNLVIVAGCFPPVA